MACSRRFLHFVFKIGDRNATIKFYRDLLGMKVLRHEEFEEGCKASCNGPYDGKWSKSLMGYGAEDNHFVVELTYNYGIKGYILGNDFQGLTIHSSSVIAKAKDLNLSISEVDSGKYVVEAPGGYKFNLVNTDTSGDPVKKVSLGVSNLSKSVEFWGKILEMTVYEKTDTKAVLGYEESHCSLELLQLQSPINHATAFGRIAFSCPGEELVSIESKVKAAGHTVLTPLVSLDTPGKATVQVVIVADPDGHEICFVGDEAFRQLSQMDPKADSLLNEAMENDKSDEWFAKRKAKPQTSQ